jgi:hypothetical protein
VIASIIIPPIKENPPTALNTVSVSDGADAAFENISVAFPETELTRGIEQEIPMLIIDKAKIDLIVFTRQPF